MDRHRVLLDPLSPGMGCISFEFGLLTWKNFKTRGTVFATTMAICFLMFPTERCEQSRIIEAFRTRPNISYPICYRNITNTDPGQFYNTRILNRFDAEKEGNFYLVQGPHGIGKTTTLSLYASMSKGNVLYFQIASPKNFGLHLAEALVFGCARMTCSSE